MKRSGQGFYWESKNQISPRRSRCAGRMMRIQPQGDIGQPHLTQLMLAALRNVQILAS